MPPPQDARPRPRLSIVAPCYNEEAGLEDLEGPEPAGRLVKGEIS